MDTSERPECPRHRNPMGVGWRGGNRVWVARCCPLEVPFTAEQVAVADGDRCYVCGSVTPHPTGAHAYWPVREARREAEAVAR